MFTWNITAPLVGSLAYLFWPTTRPSSNAPATLHPLGIIAFTNSWKQTTEGRRTSLEVARLDERGGENSKDVLTKQAEWAKNLAKRRV